MENLLEIARQIHPEATLTYQKTKILFSFDGRPASSVHMFPKKNWVQVTIRLPRSEEPDSRLEDAGFDLDYNSRRGRYRINLRENDVRDKSDLLKEMVVAAYDAGE